MNNLIRSKQVCQKLSISTRTLARWRSEGMPFIRLSRSSIRYELHAVLEWISTKSTKVK